MRKKIIVDHVIFGKTNIKIFFTKCKKNIVMLTVWEDRASEEVSLDKPGFKKLLQFVKKEKPEWLDEKTIL